MKSLKELHQDHMGYLWRIRVQYTDDIIRCTNGFSLRNNVIVCSPLFVPPFEVRITGRRMDESGFRRRLRLVHSEESRGIMLLEEEDGSSSKRFGVLSDSGDLNEHDHVYLTTSYPGWSGCFYESALSCTCREWLMVDPKDTDDVCGEYIPTRLLEEDPMNAKMGEVFVGRSLEESNKVLKLLLGTINIITGPKIPPDDRGSGGVVTNREGLIVGMLSSGVWLKDHPATGVAIHVSAIRKCVKNYENEKAKKIKQIKRKHREGNVKEGGSYEKQPKEKKFKKNMDIQKKGKQENYRSNQLSSFHVGVTELHLSVAYLWMKLKQKEEEAAKTKLEVKVVVHLYQGLFGTSFFDPKSSERNSSILTCSYPSLVACLTNETVEKELELVEPAAKTLRVSLRAKDRHYRVAASVLRGNAVVGKMIRSHALEISALATLSSLNSGSRIKKYRGMGSLEAMTKGSDARYLGDTAKLKIAQGVVGAVADKGSVLNFVPYTMQAVKQGFQDLGASSFQSAHDLFSSSVLRLEVRTGAAQVEGGVHGLVSYEKKSF